jgi:hypothetical protein
MVSTDSHAHLANEPINAMSAQNCAHLHVAGCNCTNLAQQGKTLCKNCEDGCGF